MGISYERKGKGQKLLAGGFVLQLKKAACCEKDMPLWHLAKITGKFDATRRRKRLFVRLLGELFMDETTLLPQKHGDRPFLRKERALVALVRTASTRDAFSFSSKEDESFMKGVYSYGT